jgi:hypothetical protein
VSAEVFIRRNGIVQGTYDREEYFASRLQGGILDGDEWMPVVGGSWTLVGYDSPFKSARQTERERKARQEQEIAQAFREVYDYRMWSSRIMEKNDHCLPEHVQPLDDGAYSFIEAISISGFGAFGPRKTIRLLHNEQDVRMLSGLTNQWVAPNGAGKTTLGVALEAVRDVAAGHGLSGLASRFLHHHSVSQIEISIRTRTGIVPAKLDVIGERPVFSGSELTRELLGRIVFYCDDSMNLDSAEIDGILSGSDFEYLRRNWLKVDSTIGAGSDGYAEEAKLRRRFESAPSGVGCSAKLLLVLRTAEEKGQILVLENPTCRLNLLPQTKFKQLFIDAPRRGARQVILLTT